MRVLLWFTLAAALVWAGWWVVGSRAALRGAEAAFAAAPAAGWQATHGGISVAGFPNRFDLTVTDPSVARGGFGWRGPFLQVFALAYRPGHLIAVLPDTQVLTLAGLDLPLTADRMQASLFVSPQGFDRSTFDADGITLAGIRAASLNVALKTEPDVAPRLRLGLEVLDIAVPAPLRPEALPPTARRLYVDGYITLSAPLDRAALTAPPRVESVEIGPALLAWGPLVVEIAGALRPDARGFASGRLSLTASDPDLAAALYARLGLPPDGGAQEIVLSGGRIRFGERDLGPAPRLSP